MQSIVVAANEYECTARYHGLVVLADKVQYIKILLIADHAIVRSDFLLIRCINAPKDRSCHNKMK